jgi:hypothetical protein
MKPFATEPTGGAPGVEDIGDVDMGAEATLENFIAWAKTTHPADHYLLVIGSHGQGYRLEIAADRAHTPEGAYLMDVGVDMMVAAPTRQPDLEQMPTCRTASFDDRTKHHLFNSDIQTALAKQQVDIVGFDACLMSMIETAYALRSGASIMVGSEEVEPPFGWRYDTWLSKLAKTPTMTPADVGKLLVDSYKDLYENRRTN